MPIGALVCILGIQTVWAAPETPAKIHENARYIFEQLIEINITDSIGSTTVAAQAMTQRLLEAGLSAADVTVIGPNERKGNMVARYRGKAATRKRPILIIAHLDVGEARREDWTTDSFQFVEQDGYYYGRGTQDMKDSDAIASSRSIQIPGAS
jgi:acetylornithine deacetylase/succinyl-diaminopimelate desuccinylase-like protein